MGDAKPELLLFMRHGQHSGGELTWRGRARVRSTAAQTADTLVEMGRFRDGVTVLYIETPDGTHEAQHTAELVQEVLADRMTKVIEETGGRLEPAGGGNRPVPADNAVTAGDAVPAAAKLQTPGASAYARPVSARDAVSKATKALEARDEAVVLVVGNDPFLSWMIHRGGGRITLERGELAALQRRAHTPRLWPWRWSVCWAIMEGEGTAADTVREKVRSKMDVAKVFGALGVAVLTFLLQERVKGTAALQSAAASLSLLAIGAGTVLFFATLFAYDLLLMPTRFWMPRRRGRRARWVSERPPSPDFWILYQNMVHVWGWLFVPACVLVGCGLVLLGLAPEASRRDWWWVWLAAAAVVVAGWWWRHRPRLGATD